MEKQNTQYEYMIVQEIDWLGKFVDKQRKTWIPSVKATLTNISKLHKLATINVKSPAFPSRFTTAFSTEAINILKEKMEKHPENFANGRRLR